MVADKIFRPCRGSFDAMCYPGAYAPGYYLCTPPGPGRHTLQPSFAREISWLFEVFEIFVVQYF